MSSIDPAEVAAHIAGCRRWSRLPYEEPHCGRHQRRWPCGVTLEAVEIIRAALEQAWLEGWNDGREQWSDGEFVHALTDNPYAKGGKS